ncbi:hypothetical protein ACSVDA_15100 [Cytobacillus sp. Hm23]
MFSSKHTILFSIGVILLLSCWLAPFFIIRIFQSLFVEGLEYSWYFAPNLSAYFLIGIALGLIGLALMLYVFLSSKKVKKLITNSMLLVVTVVSAILIFFGMNDYLYMTNDGIVVNQTASTKEKLYKWEDVETANLIAKENGKRVIEFKYSNGEVNEFRDRVYVHNGKMINHILRNNGVVVEFINNSK